MYLTHSRSEPVKISEIAEQFNVPRNHLIKVVNKLATLEWILTTRGRNGGLQLAVPPESITLATIIKALEGCEQLIDCENTMCRLRMGCQVKQYLNFGLKAFYDEMDRYTLADSVKGQTGAQIIEMHTRYA